MRPKRRGRLLAELRRSFAHAHSGAARCFRMITSFDERMACAFPLAASSLSNSEPTG
jgi:hypothetical protein